MSVLYERATDVGLGLHMDTLNVSDIESYYKVSGIDYLDIIELC